jgi:hypothetical protein
LEFSVLDHYDGGLQRFNVGISQGVILSSQMNTILLGIVQLTCKDDFTLNRSVLCFLVSDRSVIKIARAIPKSDFGGRGYTRPRTIYPPVQPTHFKVKVTPVNDESLEDGCIVIKYEEIQGNPTESSIDNKSKKKRDDVDVERRIMEFAHPNGPFL